MTAAIESRTKPGVSRPSPYSRLPARAFWRSAVAGCAPEDIQGLWQPKFEITPNDPVATYGSCFAQHIGRELRARGYNWLITERPPRGVSRELARAYNYRLFSARTGNIYTPSMLLQWLRWAFDDVAPPQDTWHEGARHRDPFRPLLEPEGFESLGELNHQRRVTLRALRRSVRRARFLVFTLGLTERWVNLHHGHEYQLCPGTSAGTFDPETHGFAPLDYPAALGALSAALDLMRGANPKLRFVLTVSPVPLTATATAAHVLTATTGAKAVLRAVAGHLAATRADTDYFPSYEIITSPVFGGRFFASNKREVTDKGVSFVMESFFRDMAAQFGPQGNPVAKTPGPRLTDEAAGELVCEEEILGAFGPRK